MEGIEEELDLRKVVGKMGRSVTRGSKKTRKVRVRSHVLLVKGLLEEPDCHREASWASVPGERCRNMLLDESSLQQYR